MAKAAKKLSFQARMWAMIKRNPVKAILTVLGVLGAYPSGLAGAKLIQAQAEPSWYASHGWVRDYFDENTKPIVAAQAGDRSILRDVQIDLANRSKRDETNNLAKWTVERDKAKDQLTIDLIDKQIQESKDSLDALTKQLNVLQNLRAKGQ